jgi:hypothetical protein
MDIVWIMDASDSMIGLVSEYETNLGNFDYVVDFVSNFTSTATMSNIATRQGYVEFAGPVFEVGTEDYVRGQTINTVVNVTDAAAIDSLEFTNSVTSLTPSGGSTDTPGAINYVREHMFTGSNRRLGSRRVAVLITDGNPSDRFGASQPSSNATNQAVDLLREEDDVIFVFLRIGNDYNDSFVQGYADYTYNTTSFSTLNELLGEQFLCFI